MNGIQNLIRSILTVCFLHWLELKLPNANVLVFKNVLRFLKEFHVSAL